MLFNYASILLLTTALCSGFANQSTQQVTCHYVFKQTSNHHVLYSHSQVQKKQLIYKLTLGLHKQSEAQLPRLTHVNVQSKVQLQFGPNISF